nr:antimicrobial peptide lynronne 1-containing protein [uncultured bacterium]
MTLAGIFRPSRRHFEFRISIHSWNVGFSNSAMRPQEKRVSMRSCNHFRSTGGRSLARMICLPRRNRWSKIWKKVVTVFSAVAHSCTSSTISTSIV